MATSDEEKGRRYVAAQKQRLAFIDKAIPELHRDGYPGALARAEADRRYGKLRQGESIEA